MKPIIKCKDKLENLDPIFHGAAVDKNGNELGFITFKI